MPIYDYLCTACDHRADILHGINDPGPTFCPSCGAEGTMRKQFAAPTIHFKGSGWAKKDRGASTRTRAAARAGDTPRDSASSGDGGSSSKDGGSSSSDRESASSGSGSDAGETGPSKGGTSSSGSSDAPKPSTPD
jgi:putative FmdB family regulatory protein